MQFGVNYLGTRDNNPLLFGINNLHAGALGVRRNVTYGRGSGFLMLASSGNDNVAIGDSAMYETLGGSGNIAIGTNALRENRAAVGSIAIGRAALQNSKDIPAIIAIGDSALFDNSTGASSIDHARQNIAVGQNALRFNSIGSDNIAIGNFALRTNQANAANIAIGHLAMAFANNTSSITNSENLAIGHQALRGGVDPALNTGTSNIAIGNRSLINNRSGSLNIALGINTLSTNTQGIGNVAIGNGALFSNTTGDANTAIGLQSLLANNGGFGNTAVGFWSLIANKTGSNSVAIGNKAMEEDTAANENVAVGVQALRNNQNRIGNTAIGTNALYWNTYTTTTPITPTQGLHNTALGHSALFNNRRGSGGVAIGFQALYSDTAADGIVAIGRNALYNNNGRSGNLAIGDSALFHNATGPLIEESARNNLAIGTKALFNNRSGLTNLAIGNRALQKNTTGQNNLAIGELALAENEITNGSIAIGNGALQNFKLPNLLSGNIAIGIQSLYGATALGNIGMNNTALGMQTLYNNYDGFQNVAIGNDVLRNNANGSQNVAVGYGSMTWLSNPNSNFNTAIGVKSFSRLANEDNNTGVGAKAGIAIDGSRNTILGANQASYEDNPSTVRSISGAVFLGYNAGVNEFSSNKLYIENSEANSDNTLIYGDFAADSLLLNAKTINRNLFGLRGAGANTGIELGYGVFLKETNAGRIGYGLATPNSIDFYGGGTSTSNRAIRFWTEGGSTFTGKLNLTTSSDNSGIELARELAGKQADAGKIQYGGFGRGTHVLNIVGGGASPDGTDRTIRLWSEGGLFIRGATQPDADNLYALGLPNRRWTNVWAANGAIQTSDANLKTNIQPSPYGLNEVLQLNPVQYNWKEQPEGKKEVGLLAQEVLKLIPEAVVVPEDGSAMGMKYSELIPVLIKAIQELKKELETLKLQKQ